LGRTPDGHPEKGTGRGGKGRKMGTSETGKNYLMKTSFDVEGMKEKRWGG